MYTNFVKLSKTGDKAEKLFAEWLEDNGYTNIEHIEDVYENEGILRSAWDIRCDDSDGVKVTFEVKGAFDCHTWGYFNVEQIQNGEPGGIAVTDADYFVMVNESLGMGIVSTEVLLKMHNEIKDKVTEKDYRDRKKIDEIILWATQYKNMACGWRQKNATIEWHK